MTLDQLEIGKSATILSVGGEGALRRHFLDMGVIPGADITLVKFAPMGDPMELRICDYALTLRVADARKIVIGGARKAAPPAKAHAKPAAPSRPEEGGKCRAVESDPPLPAGTKLTFALAGNQNCGKTTLFNRLTGSNQHVGNFPGVTVDRKDGVIRGHADTVVTDLPGIYSLSPYTSEEIITRRFVLDERPRGIINIADATNMERSLYLTMQLMELDVPMVLALNMMDEVRENGGSIRTSEMEALLGIPVVPISAARDEGIDALVACALRTARYQKRPGQRMFCGADHADDAVQRCLRDIMRLIGDDARAAGIPARFAAGKLAEGDPLIPDRLRLSESTRAAAEQIISRMEEERGLDRAAAIADMRFSFIKKVCDAAVVRPHESRGHVRSARIDRVLTGRYTAIPAFVAIMSLVFCLTFGAVGGFLSGLLESGIGLLTDLTDRLLACAGVNAVVHSLVIDGVFSGVGSVLSFLPFIITLFFFLSLLEDSGYMARVAFIMDKPLRRLGLSGRSIVPMLVGFGCTVPGVMAARTLPSERDRKMTILLTPFMSCSAKLPIYAFFSAVFFPDHIAPVMAGLYVLGIAMGILTALALRRTAFGGEPVPFVMELPNYRTPGAKNVFHLLWEKARDFLLRAFTVIFVATIAVWFLQTFDMRLSVVSDSRDSLLAGLAGLITPIFAPLGFGDWRICTALISGFMAKESVVSSLIILFGSVDSLLAALTPAAASSLLVFSLLYTPCIAALSSIRRELGGKWAVLVALGQFAIAWIAAFAVRLIGLMLL